MADELFDLRNTVTLGNFHQAIAEGSQIRSNPGRKAEEVLDIHGERDLLIARAQVGLGQFDSVISEQHNATHPFLKAAHAWATFHKALSKKSGNHSKNDIPELAAAIKTLESLSGEKPQVGVTATIVTLAAACYFHLGACGDDPSAVNKGLHICGSWVEALSKQIPRDAPPSNLLVRHILELRSMCVDGLLRLSRIDLADRMLQEMRTLDDDAVITMIAGVSVAVAQQATNPSASADSRANEALAIIQSLAARCGQTTSLLNIAAIASLLANKPGDSETSLVASLGKRSTDVDTLSNLAALAATLSKPTESFNRLCGQASAASNNDAPWTKQHSGAQQRFREASAAFVASS